MRYSRSAVLIIALALAAPLGDGLVGDGLVFAATPDPAKTPSTVDPVKPDTEADLTPAEKAERDSRKACKVAICSAFRAGKSDGGNIACSVVKSWRKTQLDKMISKVKMSWPYGPVKCTADVKLNRADLIKATKDEKFETKLEKHLVTCTIDQDGGKPTEIKIGFAPTVTFEKGKAVSARMNWDELEAPSLVKGMLWTATGTDNTLNVLSGTLVEDINGFITKKCDEVKADWEGK